jgi:hypothetical protein
VLFAIEVKDTRRRTKYAQRLTEYVTIYRTPLRSIKRWIQSGKYADDLPLLHGSACNAVMASSPHETPYCGSFSVRKAVINSLAGMPVPVSF